MQVRCRVWHRHKIGPYSEIIGNQRGSGNTASGEGSKSLARWDADMVALCIASMESKSKVAAQWILPAPEATQSAATPHRKRRAYADGRSVGIYHNGWVASATPAGTP